MNKARSVRKRLTPAQRENILASYLRSDLTQRDFAAQAGISLSCLHSWLRKSTAAPLAGGKTNSLPLPGFIEMPRALPLGGSVRQPAASPAYKLQFPGGLSLEIPRGFESQEVARLCGILQRL